ncbi:MAG: hypothetical protein HQL40_01025 [Alphaproteobacteria bacterium]|nr:hypothetical protein [Alphaproteobacteria bacterium]
MDVTVADTIRELTRGHIAQNGGLVMGQCLSAVGWVQNTIPAQEEGMVELPMTDIAGAGFAVGAALAGRRPIFVIRYQSFLWLNVSPIVNYAAKAKEMFGYSCPVFVRAIADEGNGLGPLHSNCYHSMFMNMPGIPVCAPMTPREYVEIWEHYMSHDDPMLVSEHRRCFRSSVELPDITRDDAVFTIYAASAGRFNARDAVEALAGEGIACNLVNILWLKPFELSERTLAPLRRTGKGIVIDSTYEIAGASRSMAYDLMDATGARVRAVGLPDRSPGAAKHLENGTPSVERIVAEVKGMLGR